ncbi:MAG TPA: adenylate/guanylate cyclase domain-containing protein [Ferruginibacter sp.]|nr:adenylate/guanylate cyclase domain-containing protein [Ferruginibacter sp.]
MLQNEKQYEISDTIYDGSKSIIYRARHVASKKDIIIKKGKTATKAGLYNEYNLALELNGENSLVSITEIEKVPALIRPFYPGKTLGEEIENKNHGVIYFFNICFKMIDELNKLHGKHIIHNDLNPQNIITDHAENKVHIIDFESGTHQQFQQSAYKGASVIEGVLQYISPEQTGRMNRVIDYRSDFYSLGIIFYEILSGKKPFENEDALELIHCHIALLPPSLHIVDVQIPKALATVIEKLMAKNAEERYQSLSGLQIDLAHCQKEWISTGTVEMFELGKADLPLRLHVSQKLFGRKTETEKIFSLYEEAAAGKKIILGLRGLSGLGKTKLIQEAAKPLTAHKGVFISGKFDSLHRNIPYYGWAQAFNQLADLLFTENEETISRCRKLLNENMQGLECDIIAIAPRWKTLFSNISPLPMLNPKEQQSRIQFAVSLFIKSILKIVKPVLFFVDDWQWADEASIELLRSISGDVNLKKLFLALAYRQNETDSTHPFIRALTDIELNQKEALTDSNLIVDSIEIKPLTVTDTNELLAETFSCITDETNTLAGLIFAKTQGNPFFIIQLLDYLYTKKLIWLNVSDCSWKWNITGIRELVVTENIATVIIDKINNISPQNLEILTFASCLGHEFSLSSLRFITKIPEQKLHALLWEAIKENIIEPLDKDYKFVPKFYEANKTNVRFKFTHDRIQQALYNRTESKLREELHFEAAEYSMANPQESDNIFITANHLVASGSLLINSNHCIQAAQILLQAGQKAFSSAAYDSSFIFLKLFEQIVDKESLSVYDYCLLILSAHLNSNETKIKEYEEKAFAIANGKIERSQIYEATLKGSIAMNKLNEAIIIARKAFNELGFRFPKTKASKWQVIWGAIKIQIAFPNKKIKEITRFADMTDEAGKHLMQLIYTSLEPFYFVERDTYPLLIFKMVNLSVKQGNTPESIIGYGSYGLILAGVLNKLESGYTVGKEAMKLFDHFNAPHLVSTAGFVNTTFILHWKESLASFEKDCLLYYEKGLNTGNLEYAAWNLYTHSNSIYFRGAKLAQTVEMFDNYEKFYLRHRQLNAYGASVIIKNTLSKMLLAQPASLTDSEEEFQLFNRESKANNTVFSFVYHNMKIFLGVFHLQYSSVLKNVEQNQKDIANTASLYWQPYFTALKTVAYINSSFEGVLNYNKVKNELKSDRKKLVKARKVYDGNIGWILGLMDAEIATYETRTINHQLYSRAAENAENFGFQFPAILIELMRIQKMKYLDIDGCRQYWYTLRGKLADLEINSVIYAWELKFPEFKEQKNLHPSSNKGEFSTEQFDAKTIIKTTEALSSEIILTKLVDKMMLLSMENAGARYGCFMVLKDKNYELVAEKFADEYEKQNNRKGGIPASIFNYVIRTKEPLIIGNAMDAAPYKNDPGVIAGKEKSILCIPIINQNTCIALLYLANELSKSIFTEERIGLLKMLAGQMGVSLQNAILYDNMEKLVEKRTEQLAQEIEKTDNLLLNILPREVATELKTSGKATPKYYQHATVMFCDIIDFTKRAEKLSAVEIIDELHLCFKSFDEIIARHQIEKIKTIGDAYLCVGGIPTENENHALNTVAAAIEIQQWMKSTFEQRASLGKDYFRLRVGIHTGPVVAGVVGSLKFAYDIWGDTVNTASRMEQNSEGGKINISDTVFEIIKDKISCTFRGEIEAKNKGMLKMYFVNTPQ